MLKVYNTYSKKYDGLDVVHTIVSNKDYIITNDRLDYALFNQSIEDVLIMPNPADDFTYLNFVSKNYNHPLYIYQT